MKIFCLSDSTLIGGAEIQMLTLFQGISAAGHELRLLCCGERYADQVRSRGLIAEALGSRFRHPSGFVKGIRAVRHHIHQEAPDLLHAEGVSAAVVAALGRAGLSRPPGLIATVHNLSSSGTWAYGLATLLLRLTGAYLTTVSESERARYLRCGFPERRSRTVYNGVDIAIPDPSDQRRRIRASLGIPAETTVVIHVGRLSPEKGHSLLLDAVAGIASQGLDFRLLCAGDGPLRPAIEKDCIRLGLEERVQFLGFRTDVSGLLAASDLLVLPSLSEAFPMVLLEAMACGLPVLASRVGGVPELVEDGREGWLVEPGDLAGLRRALDHAIRDAGARRERGLAGQARVADRFSRGKMIEETLRVYDMVLGESTGASR
jgi:glycosyltransferase involved in cell wall biosynthesis